MRRPGYIVIILAIAFQFCVGACLAQGQLFSAPTNYPVGEWPVHVSAGDLDNDGDLDLAVSVMGSGDSARFGHVAILMNHGNGTFETAANCTTAAAPHCVSISDIDEDGDNDLCVVNWVSDNLSILTNSGQGVFHLTNTIDVGHKPSWLIGEDVNGDSHIDLAVSNKWANTICILISDGTGGFLSPVYYYGGNWCVSLTAGDIDADNDLDIAVSNGWGDSVEVFRNNGDGTLLPLVSYSVGEWPTAVCLVDLDGDGDNDLVKQPQSSINLHIPKYRRGQFCLYIAVFRGRISSLCRCRRFRW